MWRTNKEEAQLWLRSNIFPLIREVDNSDGSTKTKLRPIALLKILLKLIKLTNTLAHHCDAEAMISAVRKFLKSDTNRVLMQGDISNPYGSINKLAVLKAVREHIRCLVPLCASLCVGDGTVAGMQQRDGSGKKSELHHCIAKGVWQGSTLSSASFRLTFWSKTQELLDRANSMWTTLLSIDDDDALWDATSEALKEIGLEIDQSKSCYMRHERTEWDH